MIKPVCGTCNLVCDYCYYRRTAEHFDGSGGCMSDEVLRAVVQAFCDTAHPCPHFSWQGGEPMLAGLEFFRKAVGYQQAFSRPGRQIVNMFQTNGTLLDDAWCRFLKRWGMLVGISIDGPSEIHDKNRAYPNGRGSLEDVLRGLRLLRQYQVEHNVLVLVHDGNVRRAKEVYRFIRSLGEDYLQFIPCVVTGLDRSRPGIHAVDPVAYGEFLCEVFDEWLAAGPARSYDRTFNNMVLMAAGLEPEICVFRRDCAGCLLVERNGDVFPCDFLVQPEWKLGNLLTESLARIFRHPRWAEFRAMKSHLPEACRECGQLDLCRGGCPRDRFGGRLPNGEPNYLCPAYRTFFRYARPMLTKLAEDLVLRGNPSVVENKPGAAVPSNKPRQRSKPRRRR